MTLIFPILQHEESESFNDEELSNMADEISKDSEMNSYFEELDKKVDKNEMVRSKTYESKLLSPQFEQTDLFSPRKGPKRTHMYRSRTFDESHEQKQKHAASKSLKLIKTKSFDKHNLNLFEASKSISTQSLVKKRRRKSTKTLKLSANVKRRNAQKRTLQKRHSMFISSKNASPNNMHKKRNSYLESIIALSLSSGLKSNGIETDNYRVCELKDLIREMVGNDDTAETVRNALLLCHSSFISSIDLFLEFRRYFVMEIADIVPIMFDYVDPQRTCKKFQSDWILFIRQKIAKAVIYWIQYFWNEDFLPNPDLQKQIELFKKDIETTLSKQNSEPLIKCLQQKTTQSIEKYKEETIKAQSPDANNIMRSRSISLDQCYKQKNKNEEQKEYDSMNKSLRDAHVRYPALRKLDDVFKYDDLNLTAVDPEIVAAQITLLDSFLFKQIKQREFNELGWKKQDRAIRSPNITKMIAQFNDLTNWVQVTILQQKTPKIRKKYIKRMIKMCSWFMQHKNLSSLCAFHAALSSKNIASLHISWKLVSKSSRKEFNNIKLLFNSWKMDKIRELQDNATDRPCIPHLGITLERINMISEMHKLIDKESSDKLINYNYMILLYEQVSKSQSLQVREYPIKPNVLLQTLLIRNIKKTSAMNDIALYQLAKKVRDSEPIQRRKSILML